MAYERWICCGCSSAAIRSTSGGASFTIGRDTSERVCTRSRTARPARASALAQDERGNVGRVLAPVGAPHQTFFARSLGVSTSYEVCRSSPRGFLPSSLTPTVARATAPTVARHSRCARCPRACMITPRGHSLAHALYGIYSIRGHCSSSSRSRVTSSLEGLRPLGASLNIFNS